jgi:hypothetical protein
VAKTVQMPGLNRLPWAGFSLISSSKCERKGRRLTFLNVRSGGCGMLPAWDNSSSKG